MRSDWVSIMLTAVKMFLLALKHSGSFSKKKKRRTAGPLTKKHRILAVTGKQPIRN